MDIVIARQPDVTDLARLLWLHASADEQKAQPLEAFTAQVAGWLTLRTESHVAFMARLEHAEIVGMAWLALVSRPPRPGAVARYSADLQSVFVVPEHRGQGIGSALVRAAVAHAERHHAAQVTVSSSTKAVLMYERLGFHSSRELLGRSIDG